MASRLPLLLALAACAPREADPPDLPRGDLDTGEDTGLVEGCLSDEPEFMTGFRIDLQRDWEAGIAHAADHGIPWVNLRIQWALHEPSQGAFDWSALETALLQAEDLDVGIWGLVVTTPPWASDPDEQAALDQGYWGRLAPVDPAHLADFTGELVARYGCRIPLLEIYNEVNGAYFFGSSDEYVNMLNLAYEAIKERQPGVVVAAPALATLFATEDGRVPPELHHGETNSDGLGLTVDEWLQRFLELDPQLDWFTHHPYGPNLGPTELAAELDFIDNPNAAYFGMQGVQTLRSRLDKAGHSGLPVLLSEQGYLDYGSALSMSMDVNTAAGLLVEEYVLARTFADVNGLGWFVYDTDNDTPGSLVDSAGELRPALEALRVVQGFMADYPVHEQRLLGEPGVTGAWMEWFSGADGDLMVVFNPTASLGFEQGRTGSPSIQITLETSSGRRARLVSFADLAKGDLTLVEQELEADENGDLVFTSTPVPSFLIMDPTD